MKKALRRAIHKTDLALLRRSRSLRAIKLYQPLPWIGANESKRSEGTIARMAAIEKYLTERSLPRAFVADIGCNVGYFSLSFCERGSHVYAIESDAKSLDIARLVKDLHIPDGVLLPLNFLLNAGNVRYLPSADVYLCLSVWHHWVKHYGWDAATAMLATVFAKTEGVLFFDTGQEELPEDYGLSHLNADFAGNIERYLRERLKPSRVDRLGEFKAFSPASKMESDKTKRTLFAVVK